MKEEYVEESQEQKKKRDDLEEREKQVDEFHQQLNAKEKELYLKEQELTETEQRSKYSSALTLIVYNLILNASSLRSPSQLQGGLGSNARKGTAQIGEENR